MKMVILAGGTGTGLWPVSRIYYPKQFTKFKVWGKSTFQITIENSAKVLDVKNIIIVTNIEYKYFVLTQLQEIGISIPDENILLEPRFQNTLHAVSLAVFHLADKGEENEKILVIPSNSMVSDYRGIFSNLHADFRKAPQDSMLIFGIKASLANSGYGYIKPGVSSEFGFTVDKFIEKPSKEDAEVFINSGYLYNSGILYFKADIFIEELRAYAPELFQLLSQGDIDKVYASEIKTTVEKGILEKSKRLFVLPVNEEWNNLNEFSNFYQQYDENQDESGNISFNDNVFVDASNNFVYSENNKVVSVIGADNLVIIDQPDALLVCNSADTDKVKNVAAILKGRNDPRAEFHTTCYRPWGSYTVLEEGTGYKIKRITVLPGKKLSYQLHHHRSEHWVVAKGTANVVKDGRDIIVNSGESIFLSVGEKHRMENQGTTILEVIEVQIGSYLDEDDIVRFDDEYGR